MISISTIETLYNSGLNVLPLQKDKRPACRGWKEIQEDRQTEQCFKEYFAGNVFGVAVPTGYNNRELVDIDTKHDLSGTLIEDYKRIVEDHEPGLWERLTEVKTTSGGRHLIYRCKEIEGNQKLAQRPRTDEEITDNPNANQPIVLIETRGKGGYAAGPPTPGYELLRGDYANPVWITPEERAVLLNSARLLDQVEEEIRPQKQPKPRKDWEGVTPWDDYNQKHTCLEILTRHGWTEVRTHGNKTSVRRPHTTGESVAPISGHIKNDEDVFFCWSTSTQFKTSLPYFPVDIYYLLEHGGDARAGAKVLYQAGYGERQGKRSQERPESGAQQTGTGNDTPRAQENGYIAPAVYEKDGCYKKQVKEGDNWKYKPITNFTMNGLYLIKGTRPARIIEFKAAHGEKDTIAVPVENLTADGTAKLVKGLGNFLCTWSKNQFEFILHYACRNQKKAESVEYLGHYEDGKVWIFGNGAYHYDSGKFYQVNEHGISETPAGAYHIPQYKNESEPMTYRAGEIRFRQYYELLKAAFGQNGEVGAAAVLAYAFSDILFRETGNIFLLFLAGMRETGKTSFADLIRAPFFDKKPVTVNMKSSSTVKSRYRMLAKYSNGLVVFDEFTDIPKNTNLLVTAYNRDGYSRAATSNDNETLETPVRASSLFIGNYLPESEPAAMSRLIIRQFKRETDSAKQAQSLAAYRKLTDQLRRGTGTLLLEILALRGAMGERYSEVFAGYMATESLTSLVKDTRDAEKVAAIMATLSICGPAVGLTVEEMERIEGHLTQQLSDQKSMVEATDHTSQYFTELALLIRDSTLMEEKHFAFSEDNTEVVFRFSDCYRKAQESMIKQRRELVGKGMLKRLLMEHEAFITGPENARYRLKRGGILDLCFSVDALPDDIRESLRGYPEEDPDNQTEPAEPKGGAAGNEIPF